MRAAFVLILFVKPIFLIAHTRNALCAHILVREDNKIIRKMQHSAEFYVIKHNRIYILRHEVCNLRHKGSTDHSR